MTVENFLCLVVICIDGYDVAGPAWSYFIIQFDTTHFLKRFDGFKNRYSISGSEVENFATFGFISILQVFDSKRMRICNIRYMYIIAHTTAISCRIVITVNDHLGKFANCCLSYGRNKILWPTYRKFSNLGRRV